MLVPSGGQSVRRTSRPLGFRLQLAAISARQTCAELRLWRSSTRLLRATFSADVAALGVRLATSFVDEPLSVVGVVGDVTPAGEADRPAVYVPVEQSPIGEGHVLVRTQSDPRSVIPTLTARLRRIAPDLPLDRVGRVAEALEESRAVTRFVTQLAATFAALALLLAMIGVYGLTAGDVSARWNELAIRLALGASHRDVALDCDPAVRCRARSWNGAWHCRRRRRRARSGLATAGCKPRRPANACSGAVPVGRCRYSRGNGGSRSGTEGGSGSYATRQLRT